MAVGSIHGTRDSNNELPSQRGAENKKSNFRAKLISLGCFCKIPVKRVNPKKTRDSNLDVTFIFRPDKDEKADSNRILGDKDKNSPGPERAEATQVAETKSDSSSESNNNFGFVDKEEKDGVKADPNSKPGDKDKSSPVHEGAEATQVTEAESASSSKDIPNSESVNQKEELKEALAAMKVYGRKLNELLLEEQTTEVQGQIDILNKNIAYFSKYIKTILKKMENAEGRGA